MLVKRFTGLITLLLLAVIPQLVLGQSAGKISGKVTDDKTGEALPGATVFLKGTSMGASTGLNGNYTILSVPPGSYTMRVSYVGYRNREIAVRLTAGERLTEEVKLEAVGIQGKAVVVTAQASGQNAAINEQLSSNKIMNAVSAARIRQVPDQNAAESVARLPGVYLVRQGGEGTELAIRGLAPQYNEVMIDGVQMAATSTSDRSVNLSMISSSSLRAIQLFKTATPDMDAAFLGGVVNFELREAKQNPSGGPEVDINTQGSYDNIENTYNDYKLSGTVADRFLNKKFGVLVQGIAQRINLTSDQFGGSYYMTSFNYGKPNPLALGSINLTYAPSDQRLYDATVVMDYRLPEGKIDFMNFFSRGLTSTVNRSQSYNLPTPSGGNTISYGVSYNPNTLNVITNLLDYKQQVSSFGVEVKVSHSYSENVYPGSWSMNFLQQPANLNGIPASENPQSIAKAASAKTQLNQLVFDNFSTSSSIGRGRDLTGSIDISRNINLSDLITSTLKFGGMYRYTERWYNSQSGSGTLFYPNGGDTAVVQAFPWMQQPPYSYNPHGSEQLPITLFEDPSFSYHTFLNGNYTMGVPTNVGMISQAIDAVIKSQVGVPATTSNPYSPNAYDAIANNYIGNEYRSAAYVMATINFGPQLMVLPGVRYQGLKTSYRAPRVPDAFNVNTYPLPFPHQDTTIDQYHGYWLPDLIVTYKPLSWLNVRADYTNTLDYPNYNYITPRIDFMINHSTWNNYALKPAHSQNYDAEFSVYNNTLGLLTVGGFLKQIDDFIFTQSVTITNSQLYLFPGLSPSTSPDVVSSQINNPNRVNLWGAEAEWQTHFWYLPGPLSGLILDVNYTHIFSGAKYPTTVTENTGFPYYQPVLVDTFYTDRLLDQPNDIVNLSVGYDYLGLSAIASMIYQANVFSGTNFWPELRSYKANYLRWDMVIKQDLPWHGLQAYLDLNNLNGANDVYVVQGSGFPTSESDYGFSADIGLRWSLQ